jgi:1,4-alpha-glucan branching enzyme
MRERATMIRLARVDGGRGVKATFALPADGRHDVAVVGDFNEWRAGINVLRRRGATLSTSVVLEPGRPYAFRYCDRDGNWFDDVDATRWEDNGNGGVNAIIDLADQS